MTLRYGVEQPPCVNPACGYRGYQRRTRGLCTACYERARRNGTLDQYPRRVRKQTCDRCTKSWTQLRRGMCQACYTRWWRDRGGRRRRSPSHP